MKKLLLTLLPLFSLLQAADFPLAMSEDHVAERKAAFIMNVLAPKECGEIKLSRYEDCFSLSINEEEQDIPNYMVTKPLRTMDPQQLAAFLKSGYLSVHECSDHSYSLDAHARLHGGGALGATVGAWLGWGTVNSAAVLTTKGLATGGALIAGPVGFAVGTTVGLGIHLVIFKPLSIVAAVGGGIAGAVATGPV